MALVEVDLNKSVEKNAEMYFEKAKKFRKKIEGARLAIEKSKAKLQAMAEKAEKENVAAPEIVQRKKEWYEKFRWFLTSTNFLVIGGRDATSNEIIIKKNTEQHDLVFHTDMAGSPFFVLKTEGKDVSPATVMEVADATCS